MHWQMFTSVMQEVNQDKEQRLFAPVLRVASEPVLHTTAVFTAEGAALHPCVLLSKKYWSLASGARVAALIQAKESVSHRFVFLCNVVCVCTAQIQKRHSSSSMDERPSPSPSAREYVESLHQNNRATLLFGKNNVLVQPVSV